MQQLEGFEDSTGHICLLVKLLYGLKQASQEWNIEMDTKIWKRGYVCLQSDHCVYIYRVSKDFVIITICSVATTKVDDFEKSAIEN